jgi:hypothetical protein
MAIERVRDELVRIALDRVEGFPFERFANAFYSSIVGSTFVPLGGMKDGGADARDGTIYEDGSRPEAYYQASTEVDTEHKIRRTVARLREFDRSPRGLTYLTSRTVKYSDRVERALSDDLNVTINIRDGDYIALHINDDEGTRHAYEQYLRGYTAFLRQVGTSRLITPSKHVKSPAVYVFLASEMERRGGDKSLVDAVTDALALWALEGTDPDAGILRTSDEVLERIVTELPSVRNLVAPRLRERLEAMSRKAYDGGRAVRWHLADDVFCLPFDTRHRIEDENTADEALRLRVLKRLDARLRDAPPAGLGDVGIRQAAEVALRTLQLAFEREGLEFAAFLHNGVNSEYPYITDALRSALDEAGYTGRRGILIGDGAFVILRGVLYDSHEDEREYLHRLSRTYALLFTLRSEPRLLEFFQDMSGDFRLYVGADQIVRALSEHYVQQADQMTRNTLLMASRLGAKVILTEPALDEVVHHLRAADAEYENHVAQVEHRLDYEYARQAPHIMLRVYLYARLNPELGKRQPRSWAAFVQQFCEYQILHRHGAYDDIRQYLQVTFGLTYESTSDLESLVDLEQVEQLADQLAPVKSSRGLARNDALLALAVYGRRKRRGETSRVTEFGWGTWWLTGETSILKLTRDVVRDSGRYIMRPDFLLNFLTLAPSARAARQDFAKIFPTMLGIRLARRMASAAFDEIMDKVEQAEQMEEPRRLVEMGKLSNRLKSDFAHQYVGIPHKEAAVDIAAQRAAAGAGDGPLVAPPKGR